MSWTKTGILGITGTIVTLYVSNLIIGPFFYQNLTVSAPIGLYRRSFEKPKIGDYVICRLPDDLKGLVKKDNTLLIKKIIANQGAEYEVNLNKLYIEGRQFLIYPINKIPKLHSGKFKVPENKVMIMNDSPISFDSRYFGPVDQSLIIGKIKLFIDYNKIKSFFERWFL